MTPQWFISITEMLTGKSVREGVDIIQNKDFIQVDSISNPIFVIHEIGHYFAAKSTDIDKDNLGLKEINSRDVDIKNAISEAKARLFTRLIFLDFFLMLESKIPKENFHDIQIINYAKYLCNLPPDLIIKEIDCEFQYEHLWVKQLNRKLNKLGYDLPQLKEKITSMYLYEK